MKFRTDFVTNSSDSSFLTFNIKNPKLFEVLNQKGIKIENDDSEWMPDFLKSPEELENEKTGEGKFTQRMKIVLPSGRAETLESMCEDDPTTLGSVQPRIDEYKSISAWLISVMLAGARAEENEDFYKEILELLVDLKVPEREKMWENGCREVLPYDYEYNFKDSITREALEKTFGNLDAEIEDADIQQWYIAEEQLPYCNYMEVHAGKRMLVAYDDGDFWKEAEECTGRKFVVSGNLKFYKDRDALVEYIEEEGGSVSEDISENTDYLICNDIKKPSPMVEKAKELGVSILTESAFIRMFANADGLLKEDDIYGWYMSDVLDHITGDYGVSPIFMEVWEDGKWCRKK